MNLLLSGPVRIELQYEKTKSKILLDFALKQDTEKSHESAQYDTAGYIDSALYHTARRLTLRSITRCEDLEKFKYLSKN